MLEGCYPPAIPLQFFDADITLKLAACALLPQTLSSRRGRGAGRDAKQEKF